MVPETKEDGVRSVEFVAMASTLATNMIVTLVAIGLVPAGDQEALVKLVTGLVTAMGVGVPSVVGLWRYLAGRTESKKADVVMMQHRMMMQQSLLLQPQKGDNESVHRGSC